MEWLIKLDLCVTLVPVKSRAKSEKGFFQGMLFNQFD